MNAARGPMLSGVTYWPRDVGPYVWHDFDIERVRHDLGVIAGAGLQTVRTLLPWDVFMPAVARPDDTAMRHLEVFLDEVARVELRAIPVLCAQAIGDCAFLPPYAIDVSASRAGVRAVSGGVVQPGGPRDQYTDSRMLEAQQRWLEGMLEAFAGNPVVAMWDLGHDPATVMRPRRTEQLRAWAALLAGRVHEAGERCTVTLGAADVVSARGVRLDAVAASVDAVGLAIDPGELSFTQSAADAAATAFLLQLSMRLTGDAAFHAHVAAPGRRGEADAMSVATPDSVRRFAGDVVDRAFAVGCAGVHAGASSDNAARVAKLPPFDRRPDLMQRGLVDTTDAPTLFGEAWLHAAGEAGDTQERAPWPDTIDTTDYYANLPHSIADLYAEWQRLDDD